MSGQINSSIERPRRAQCLVLDHEGPSTFHRVPMRFTEFQDIIYSIYSVYNGFGEDMKRLLTPFESFLAPEWSLLEDKFLHEVQSYFDQGTISFLRVSRVMNFCRKWASKLLLVTIELSPRTRSRLHRGHL